MPDDRIARSRGNGTLTASRHEIPKPRREHSVPWFWPFAAAIEFGEEGMRRFQDNLEFIAEAQRINAPPAPEWATPNRIDVELATMRLRDFSTERSDAKGRACSSSEGLLLCAGTVADILGLSNRAIIRLRAGRRARSGMGSSTQRASRPFGFYSALFFRNASGTPRPVGAERLRISILTRATPVLNPSAAAALEERSMILPWTCGPRSLIRTCTDLPFSRLVTLMTVPSGKVRCAAVRASLS
jgi:hypothetical protein